MDTPCNPPVVPPFVLAKILAKPQLLLAEVLSSAVFSCISIPNISKLEHLSSTNFTEHEQKKCLSEESIQSLIIDKISHAKLPRCLKIHPFPSDHPTTFATFAYHIISSVNFGNFSLLYIQTGGSK